MNTHWIIRVVENSFDGSPAKEIAVLAADADTKTKPSAKDIFEAMEKCGIPLSNDPSGPSYELPIDPFPDKWLSAAQLASLRTHTTKDCKFYVLHTSRDQH